jgi:hypothetical protein
MPEKTIQLRHQKELYVDVNVPDHPLDNRLYVLFHGLISLVEAPKDEFRAYALAIGSEHDYRFGTWLREAPLRQGTRAVLRGVSASPKKPLNSLNPKLHPVIKLKRLPDDKDKRIWAAFTLPRPRRIHYHGRGQAAITRADLLIFPTKKVSGLTVLEYKITGPFEDLELRSSDGKNVLWKAASFTEFPKGGPKIATLHIFNSPPAPNVTRTHSTDEFALSTAFLGQPLVKFEKTPQDLTEQPVLPGGLSNFEAAPLSSRGNFLDRLADFARTARFTSSHPLNDDGCKSCCSAADGLFET